MFDILSQSHCFLWILGFDEFAWSTVDGSYWLGGLKVKGCHRKFEPCLLMSVLIGGLRSCAQSLTVKPQKQKRRVEYNTIRRT